MLKKLLSVVAGLLITLSCYAADVELKDGHPDTYTVVKGDTLWDISGRFLKSPWLWPEVWQANPQIENPHLIYPGDVISLVYLDGKPHLTVGQRGFSGPRVRAEPLDSAVKPISLDAIKGFLEKPRLLTDAERRSSPYVLRPEENRLRATAGQLIYVRNLDAKVGDQVAIARPNMVYRDVPARFWSNTERRIDAREWDATRGKSLGTLWDKVFSNYGDWRKVKVLGYEVIEIANGEVVRAGNPASVLLAFGDMEVMEGDLVLPTIAKPFDMNFVPHAPKAVPDNMRVVALADALNVVGPHQVVALTRGSADGVENGQVYSIFQMGETVRDRTEYPDGDVRSFFKPSNAEVTLPEEFVGHVMIFRTFDRISYGLVMDGIRPVQLFDILHAPAQY